jgi:hypothetical protein
MSMTVDLTQFHRSMQLMAQVPKKYGPDVLNKSVLKVAIGSKGSQGLVQMTKKATQARIERDLRRNKLGLKLAVIALKARKTKPTREAVKQEYERIRKSRVQSRAYIAAGWLYAASKLAPHVPGQSLTRLGARNIPTFDAGSAATSFAMFATAGKLLAGLFNTSRGAGSVCPDQLIQIAVNNATKDNAVYLERKFGAAINDAIAGGNTAQNVT